MNLDIKKLNKTPQDGYEAIRLLVDANSKLTDALHIMSSIIDNTGPEFKEMHETRIKDFIKQFEIN